MVQGEEFRFPDEDREIPAHDERPLRSGRRISPRVLLAAIAIFAIPSLVIARGVWSASHTRYEVAQNGDQAVGSWRDVHSADYSGPPAPDHTATPAGGGPILPTEAPQRPPAAAPPASAQRPPVGPVPVAYEPPALPASAQMPDLSAVNAANAAYANAQYPGGGAPGVYGPAGAPQAPLTPAQARAAAAASRQRVYEEALHSSSDVKVDGPPSSLTSLTSQRSNTAGESPTESPEVSREVLRTTIHEPAGPYVVAAWQRIEVVMDDSIRAAGAIGGSGGGGTAWGHLTANVYDATGSKVMFPIGSRVKLDYEAPKAGERELRAYWDRLVYPPPDMRWISLSDGDAHDIRAGDPDGNDTLSVRTDDHMNHLVRVALTGAAISVIPLAIAGSPTNALQAPNPLQQAAAGLGQRINDTVNKEEDAEFSVPPTMYLDAGRHVIIKLDKDIPLPPYVPEVHEL